MAAKAKEPKKQSEEQKEPEFITAKGVSYTQSPEFRTVYTNNASLNLTAFDVQIVFGEMVDSEGDQLLIDKKVKIAMSPQLAKVLSVLLARHIKQYEQQFGVISLTPENSAATVKP